VECQANCCASQDAHPTLSKTNNVTQQQNIQQTKMLITRLTLSDKKKHNNVTSTTKLTPKSKESLSPSLMMMIH
jgi:hypothetical protein